MSIRSTLNTSSRTVSPAAADRQRPLELIPQTLKARMSGMARYVYTLFLLNVPNIHPFDKYDSVMATQGGLPSALGSASETYIPKLTELRIIWTFSSQVVHVLFGVCTLIFSVAVYIGDVTVISIGACCIFMCLFTLAQQRCMSWPLSTISGDSNSPPSRNTVAFHASLAAFTRPSVLAALPPALTIYCAVASVVLLSFAVVRLPIPPCLAETLEDHAHTPTTHLVPPCRPHYTMVDIATNIPMSCRIAAAVAAPLGAFFITFNTYHFWKLLLPSSSIDLEALPGESISSARNDSEDTSSTPDGTTPPTGGYDSSTSPDVT